MNTIEKNIDAVRLHQDSLKLFKESILMTNLLLFGLYIPFLAIAWYTGFNYHNLIIAVGIPIVLMSLYKIYRQVVIYIAFDEAQISFLEMTYEKMSSLQNSEIKE